MAHEILIGAALVAIIAGFIGSFQDHGAGMDLATVRRRRRTFLWVALLLTGVVSALWLSRTP